MSEFTSEYQMMAHHYFLTKCESSKGNATDSVLQIEEIIFLKELFSLGIIRSKKKALAKRADQGDGELIF